MDLSSAPHLQAMVAQSLEDVLACPKPQQDKKARPQQEQALKCPRCDSINTKFCYYNNYSLSQPRYFCKGCKRYWTQGGTLRNVPVGGGCRKNNKRSSSSSSSSSSSKRTQDQVLITTNSNQIPTLPLLTYDSNDLTLAFARLHNNQPTMQLALNDHDLSLLGNTSANHCGILGNQNTTMTNNTPNNTTSTFLDALKSGFLDTQGGSHSIYNNGYGNEDLGEVLSGSAGGEEGLVLPYEEMSGSTTMATTKQEFCRVRDGESRIYMNFPWQIGGDQANIGGAESGRDYWNGLGSSWHGVVNSPLM